MHTKSVVAPSGYFASSRSPHARHGTTAHGSGKVQSTPSHDVNGREPGWPVVASMPGILHLVTDRLAYALAHPFEGGPGADPGDYRAVDQQPDGNLLITVLCIDR